MNSLRVRAVRQVARFLKVPVRIADDYWIAASRKHVGLEPVDTGLSGPIHVWPGNDLEREGCNS